MQHVTRGLTLSRRILAAAAVGSLVALGSQTSSCADAGVGVARVVVQIGKYRKNITNWRGR